jgi:hypothetical protein
MSPRPAAGAGTCSLDATLAPVVQVVAFLTLDAVGRDGRALGGPGRRADYRLGRG